jgi:hypothetical protein
VNFQANSGQDALGNCNRLPAVSLFEGLAELCVLLEEHAPSWYSEEQRKRVLAARRLPIEVLVELYALLEDYAPTWYTEEHHDRAMSVLRALGLLEIGMDKEPEQSLRE